MRQFLVRRLAALALTILFVSVLTFTVIRILPGDPAQLMLGAEASPEAHARLRESLGLNRPLASQFAEWLSRALRGDLGQSFQYDLPVGALIMSRLRVTLPLTLLAALLMLLTALPLGVYAATHRGRPADYITMSLSQLGLAIPSFWAGLLLILVFSVSLRWAPAGGFDGWEAGIGRGLSALVLPAFALGLIQAALLTRMTRTSVLENLHAEYVRTARAKGLLERMVIWKHVMRNSLIAVLTLFGLQLGHLLAGSIIVENVFALPGLGRLILGAIRARDLPLVQGLGLFVASLIVCVNFAVDLLYKWADPRIRYE